MSEELKEILNALSYCDFSELSSDDEDEDYGTCDLFYKSVVEPFRCHYSKSFEHDKGATKGVLMFEKLGFVIKIPFIGDTDQQFHGANNSENDWNYCETEYEIFKLAERENIGKCFANIEKAYIINDHPIYIQEFAYISDSKTTSCISHTEEDEDKAKTYCHKAKVDIHDSFWLGDAIAYYGEKIFQKLMSFIKDNEINDLHGGNIGYIGERPVLIDYSGYNN